MTMMGPSMATQVTREKWYETTSVLAFGLSITLHRIDRSQYLPERE